MSSRCGAGAVIQMGLPVCRNRLKSALTLPATSSVLKIPYIQPPTKSVHMIFKKILGFVFCLLCCSGWAQNTSAEAARLADTLTENSWKAFEQLLPTVKAVRQSQLKTEGATEKASAALSSELGRFFTRENFSRVEAQFLADSFTEAELKEMSAFFQSQLGQKYLHFDGGSAFDKKYFEPMLKQACDAAIAQLDPLDRGSINRSCGRFK
jgi:hypothetical protein